MKHLALITALFTMAILLGCEEEPVDNAHPDWLCKEWKPLYIHYTIAGHTYYYPSVKEGTLTFSKDGFYSLSYLIIYKEPLNQYSDTLICLENGYYQLTNQKYKYDGGWSGLGKYIEGTIHFTPSNGNRQWSSLVDNDMGYLSIYDTPVDKGLLGSIWLPSAPSN